MSVSLFSFILWLLLPVLVSSCELFVFGLLVVLIVDFTFCFSHYSRVLADDSISNISDYLDSDLCLLYYNFCLAKLNHFFHFTVNLGPFLHFPFTTRNRNIIIFNLNAYNFDLGCVIFDCNFFFLVSE